MDHKTISFAGGSVFMERNGAFLTPQLALEKYVRFVRVAGGSRFVHTPIFFTSVG